MEECGCGVLHITLGALTIRLQTEVVASIWETLGEALSRIAAVQPRAGIPRTRAPERPS
ncbi:Hypothetical protein A7982_06750 [Minicystis rosea]|nr:Hypothetical protein A7982_06750 [Minicystis rosea]